MITLPFAMPVLSRLAKAAIVALVVAGLFTAAIWVITNSYHSVLDRGYAAGETKERAVHQAEVLAHERALAEAQRKYDQLVASIPGQIQAAMASVPVKVEVVQEAAKHDSTYRDYRRPAAVDRVRKQQLEEIRAAGHRP